MINDGWTSSEIYEQGLRAGYSRGEGERIALATANSDLRSQVRELQAELKALL